MNSGKFRKKRSYFTQISNTAIRDETLSFKAKGLYALIQSYITIEGFTLYKGFLMTKSLEGQKAFDSAWKELKDAGYLIQYKLQKETTKIFYYEYELLDEKINPEVQKGSMDKSNNPDTQKVYMDNVEMEEVGLDIPQLDNRGCINNTNINNTDINNTIYNNNLSNYQKDSEEIDRESIILSLIDDLKEYTFSSFEDRHYRRFLKEAKYDADIVKDVYDRIMCIPSDSDVKINNLVAYITKCVKIEIANNK